MTPELRSIPLASLTLSQSPAQAERRKRFDKAKLGELTDSVKEHGVVQPIVVRPRFKEDHGQLNQWEVVAGERRYLAAKAAGLPELLATVRDLSDEQAQEIQLIENLQREDLHELVEAEAYEALAKMGHTVEEMAAKVGKSTATVYARMKLLALCKEARKAFSDDKISASIALLLARIPVEALQKEALKEILEGGDWGDGSMSYREAKEHVQSQYMLRLDEATFPTSDAALVPAAGPCGSCPKNTARQPELFADVSKKAHCTDPTCFEKKKEAHIARQVAAAEASGTKVITGAEAKKILPYAGASPRGAYVSPTDRCFDDPKNRTYKELVGKDAAPVLVRTPESGEIVEVYARQDITPALKARGLKPERQNTGTNDYHRAAEKKSRRENEFRRQLFAAVLEKAPAKLGKAELVPISIAFVADIWHENQKAIVKAWGWDTDGKGDPEDIVKRRLPDLSEADVARFLFSLTFVRELHVSPYDRSGASKLLAAAKLLKVNAEKIRREIADAAKKPTKAKASKKRK